MSTRELPQIHVPPGESRLVREPAILCTLLGSCVGITFWVKRLQAGALCHPMLPSLPSQRSLNPDQRGSRRYVDYTIRDLAARLDAIGATRRETQVKVFGGADVLDFNRGHERPTVGRLNSEAAASILRIEGYKVSASSVGGDSGVQIRFNTANGEVLLRRFGGPRKAEPAPRTLKASIPSWT